MRNPLSAVVAFVAAAVALAGCFGARSNPTEFYVLTSMAENPRADASGGALDVAVGLGPFQIPEYLDRPQLVTRLDENQVAVSEYERWAGSLRGDFAEALAANLAVLLQSHDIVVYPWQTTRSVEYAVSVSVVRFERRANGSAELVAGWEIRAGAGGARLDTRVVRISEPADSVGTSGSVAALSRALAEFSQELGAAIRAVHAREDA